MQGVPKQLKTAVQYFAVTLACCSFEISFAQSMDAQTRAEVHETIRDRIDAANSTFDDHVESAPNQDMSVTASFKYGVSIYEAVAQVKAYGLTIEGFRHGDAAHSGGYTMRLGEPVQAAIDQYDYDRRFFTQRDLENTEEMMTTATDKAVLPALQKRKRETVSRQERDEREGLLIIGIDLHGKGKSLKEFSEAHAFVRVMEIREDERRNAAILPTD